MWKICLLPLKNSCFMYRFSNIQSIRSLRNSLYVCSRKNSRPSTKRPRILYKPSSHSTIMKQVSLSDWKYFDERSVYIELLKHKTVGFGERFAETKPYLNESLYIIKCIKFYFTKNTKPQRGAKQTLHNTHIQNKHKNNTKSKKNQMEKSALRRERRAAFPRFFLGFSFGFGSQLFLIYGGTIY